MDVSQASSVKPDPEHAARAHAAIAYAYGSIPFYRNKRPPPGDLAGPLSELLSRVPLLWKHQIRTTLPKEWAPDGRDVKAELASGEIELVETSGSTADRTRILWDKGWWLTQEERGMRTNAAVDRSMGDAARYREAILTTPVCGLGSCHTGDMSFEERLDEHRLFLNSRADPTFWRPEDMTRMLDELARHRTTGLESDPTYLATLARHATRAGRTLAVSDFVTLTYAMTSAAHLRAIRRAVSAPVFQLYGASEVGVLFMEGEDGLLHHCPLTTHVELLPLKAVTPGAKDVALVVVTTMDRKVQPLVRFVVGDLAQVDRSSASLFTGVPPIVTMEGRLQDAIVRPDGALVTAAAFDRALAPLTDIASYQANQANAAEVVVDVVADGEGKTSLASDVCRVLAPLLAGLRVSARMVTGIPAESSGKFRIVRRQLPLDLGAFIDGATGVMA
jgi:phenylacetate-coenzyme A ligase PaaK-like adenylate-forming protein